ncbi:helix-turn-helix domain-containing protein [Chryseobacterium sp. Y16C]|uniref:helix-turn-helix domain-containing protein n=1 Tax=Chryseobacterium sp. Y16C TaxID=2920939 RepID=UPI001F0A67F2|nr:helix-turn-helix domain-containing protein [Chryseobacterium sp. Y16C]UMQ42351.1 helix-turn-helix domain-containing protein [Chryseobacterium sp. Y16C]
MRKYYYLFLVLFSFQIAFAQNTESIGTTPETRAIDAKLNEIHKKTKTFIDPKYELPLLQLKAQSQKLGYEEGVLRSGDYLMGLYVGIENDKKASDLALELKKVAQNRKDYYGHISSIYRRSGLTLGYLGLSDASLKDFQKAISYAEEVKNNDKKRRLLAFAYNNINIYYTNIKKEPGAVDSMRNNFKKSLEMAKMISDNDDVVSINEKYDLIADLNIQLAILYLENNNFKDRLKLAEEHLLDVLAIYNRFKQDPINKARAFNELSRLYLQKKEPQKAIEYGQLALESEKQHSGPNIRLKSYKALLEAYLENNDTEKSKLYQKQYTRLFDSLNYITGQTSNSTMKKMVNEVEYESKESSKKQWMITGVLALIAGLVTAILWRRKNKALRKKYEQMMVHLKNEAVALPEEVQEESNENDTETESESEQELTSKNTISADTEARILKKLTAFEKSEKYLKKDLTISSLAAQLNTNTKYLSEVIKNNRSQNFNHYINGLRINYIVHKLYNEPKYREYKISYLAEECGYASPQVFVIAFKKINGLTPSYFIQNLKEDKVNISASA